MSDTAIDGGGLAYHRLQRLGPWSWWRPVLGVLGLLVAFVVVVPVVVLVVFTAGIVVSGADVTSTVERMLDTDRVTPLALAYLNVAIAAMIPVTWLLMRALHGLRPRWLASVAPRIRWRWLAACFGLAMASLVVTLMVAALLPARAEGAELGGGLNDFTSTTRDFLLIIALLTPLQAAGEEYVFRGYLTQAFGGLVRTPWLAVLGPALLFALAHGAQDPPVFFDRFAFGVVSGLLVILTGGLEAGIAMHVLNNFLAFGVALAFGEMATVLNPTGGTWWSLPVTLTQSLSFLGLTVLVARATGLQTRTERLVLEAPGPRV
jgi:uncharacterized protein